MHRNQNVNYLRYGMAILILVFLIAGLTKAVREKSENTEVIKLSESADAEKKTENDNKDIRVLIMTEGYKNTVHPQVSISSDGEMKILANETKKYINAGEELVIQPDDAMFQDGCIKVETSGENISLNSISRGYGCPSYDGILELWSTAEGIVIINELPVEEYLCAVVPSEMPASYELEALKAQAVCARSYAYRQMEDYAYPEYEAHVNDSTDYQVYGNSKPQETTKQAVKETAGEAVYYQGNLVTTYYYSTSCGKTTDVGAWGTEVTESNAYLQSVEVKGKDGDYERNLPWYKWKATIPVDTLSNLIGLNTGEDIGSLTALEVTKRGAGDVAVELKATGEKGTVIVETENKIRAALGGEGYQIEQHDGTITDSRTLLPSAFFTITKEGDDFVVEGGGFGHGIGMSQNGANEMAKQGKDYKEILQFFYQGVAIE